MKSTVLVFWVVAFLLFCDVYGMNYITWDDMKVDNNWQSLDMKMENYNRSRRVIVVDHKGGGDSVTVQGAIDMVPVHNSQRVKIYILPGIYREKVHVPASKPYISFIGDQNRAPETIITWNNTASDNDINGFEIGTYNSSSVSIESDYFCATEITFENSIVAAPGEVGKQAVALRVAGDKAMFYKIRVLGTQDTLLDQTGTHFYYKSYIQGSIDFIFGNSKSLFQECTLHSIANEAGAIAAHHRDSPNDDTGFSFVKCTITGTGKIFLGRAWGSFSITIFSYCHIDDIIKPSGWSDWNVPSRQRTVFFGEYKCRGKGSDRRYRAPWSRSLSYSEARSFLDMEYIGGDQWIRL